MKPIDKDRYNKRIKNCDYRIFTRYDLKDNRFDLATLRNGVPMEAKDLTDEDVILLSQMADQVSTTLHRELCERDLVPDDMKAMMLGGISPVASAEA